MTRKEQVIGPWRGSPRPSSMSLPAVVPIKIAHGCYAAAYPDGDPAALMERALRGDGELSRYLRENGWSGDWTPLERETLPVEPPATH